MVEYIKVAKLQFVGMMIIIEKFFMFIFYKNLI